MSIKASSLFIELGCPDLFEKLRFRNVDRIPSVLTDGTMGYVVVSLNEKEIEELSKCAMEMVSAHKLSIDLTGDWSTRLQGTKIHIPVFTVRKSERG